MSIDHPQNWRSIGGGPLRPVPDADPYARRQAEQAGRHVLTFDRAWEAYKLAVAVEAIAWELPVTVEALEQGADLPQVYRTAAAGTERAWRSYITMRREQAARRAASMVRAGQFPPVTILVPRIREEA